GGGSGGAVTVKRLGDGAAQVYFRVGDASWQALTLADGQGSFTATGQYEVAALCEDGDVLHLFKASVGYRDQVVFPCGNLSGPGTRAVRFEVTLPSAVGSQNLQAGDTLFVGTSSTTYTGTNPVTVDASGLRSGSGNAVLTLHRSVVSSAGASAAPYAYKVVAVGGSDTSVTVDATGWQAISPAKTLAVSLPAGLQGGGFVLHLKDAYLNPAVVGLAAPLPGGAVTGQYATLSSDGVYVGVYQATSPPSADRAESLVMVQDTEGGNWNATPPALWASGQFSVEGNTLTFSRTDARAFTVDLNGLASRVDGRPLGLRIFVQAASDGSTTYRIPVVPELNYELLENPETVRFSLQAVVQDRGLDLLGVPGVPTEAQVRGINVVLASRSGSYEGRSYTLP
ncbi:hypothetical protein, partial [Fervidobacterium sp.]